MADDRSVARLAALAHALVHRDRLSPQAAWRVLRESYGLQATIAEVEDALERSECDHCPASSPEPAQRPAQPPAAVRQVRAGYLTDMLGRDDG
jgi:hypothetical protein